MVAGVLEVSVIGRSAFAVASPQIQSRCESTISKSTSLSKGQIEGIRIKRGTSVQLGIGEMDGEN